MVELGIFKNFFWAEVYKNCKSLGLKFCTMRKYRTTSVFILFLNYCEIVDSYFIKSHLVFKT